MSLGLGHSYWVQIIRMKHGTLEECIKYMQEYRPAVMIVGGNYHQLLEKIRRPKRCTYMSIEFN